MDKSKKAKLQPVTMAEVGKHAGVSQSTVSRAMKGDRRITESVRKKVEESAEKLGYRPNPLVSALTTQVRGYRRSPQHATLCILHSLKKNEHRVEDPYFEGTTKRAAELGFKTDLLKLSEIEFSIETANRIIRARSYQGVLILPVTSDFSLENLDLTNIASATVDPSLKTPDIHRASPDYFHSMQLVLHQLELRGCKRISFCTWQDEQARIGQRWMGSYLNWQATRNKTSLPYIATDWETQPFVDFVKREQPDAIVSNSNFFYNTLLKENIAVPDKIAFASLGAAEGDSALAGIDQCNELIASAATDLVIGQIYRNENGIPINPKSVSVRGKWIEGETVSKTSTGPKTSVE